jgi:hypothetical protein
MSHLAPTVRRDAEKGDHAMVEGAVAVLASLVFGVLWLSSQTWFDLLPRRATRGIGIAGLVVLAAVAYAAPTAFQDGVQRFVDRAAKQANERVQDMLRSAFDDVVPQPPEVSPTPTLQP